MKRAEASAPGLPWEALLDRLLERAGGAASGSALLVLAQRLLQEECPGAALTAGPPAVAAPPGSAELRLEAPVALGLVVPEPVDPAAGRFLRTLAALLAVARGRLAEAGGERGAELGAPALDQVIEAVNGIVWEAPLGAGGWSYVSAGAARILGYPAENWKRPAFWRQIVHPEDRAAVAERAGAQRGDRELEYRLCAADGRVVWFHDAVRLVRDAGGAVWGQRGVMLDITARVEAEEARARATQEAVELQKIESLGLMAGGIAQDFNNLLTIILGNASLAAMRLSEHSPARGCMDDIIANGQRASELTRQLLAYAGRSQLMPEAVPMGPMVRELRGMLAASVPRNGRLEVDVEPVAHSVDGDRGQLQHVVVSLVANAAEALEDRSGTVRVATSCLTLEGGPAEALRLPKGDYVLLTVSDDGAGMDEATRRRMFDPFFSTRRSGRGLGLAVVHGVVKAHRGTIEVESAPGRGTTVRVYLPASVTAGPTRAPVVSPIITGTGLVLVIDDESEVRATARAMLEALGYDVIEAEDGRSGLVQFDRHRNELCVVLLDMTMPVMSGEEVLAELRRRSPTVPVVLSTGFSKVDARRGGSTEGLNGFLQKPYTVRQLGVVIGRAAAEGRKEP